MTNLSSVLILGIFNRIEFPQRTIDFTFLIRFRVIPLLTRNRYSTSIRMEVISMAPFSSAILEACCLQIGNKFSNLPWHKHFLR